MQINTVMQVCRTRHTSCLVQFGLQQLNGPLWDANVQDGSNVDHSSSMDCRCLAVVETIYVCFSDLISDFQALHMCTHLTQTLQHAYVGCSSI